MHRYRRWPKGTYMQLVSAERLRSFVGDPAKNPGVKMSQRRLARYIDRDPSFINHLTSGRRKSCKPRTAELIAEALDVPLDVLFVPEVASSATSISKEKVPA